MSVEPSQNSIHLNKYLIKAKGEERVEGEEGEEKMNKGRNKEEKAEEE